MGFIRNNYELKITNYELKIPIIKYLKTQKRKLNHFICPVCDMKILF